MSTVKVWLAIFGFCFVGVAVAFFPSPEPGSLYADMDTTERIANGLYGGVLQVALVGVVLLGAAAICHVIEVEVEADAVTSAEEAAA